MPPSCEVESTYRAWFQRAQKVDSANFYGVWGEPPTILVEETRQYDLAKLIGQMPRQRAKRRTLSGSLKANIFDRRVTGAILGMLTVGRLLCCYCHHGRGHYDRLRRYKAVYSLRSGGGDVVSQRRPTPID